MAATQALDELESLKAALLKRYLPAEIWEKVRTLDEAMGLLRNPPPTGTPLLDVLKTDKKAQNHELVIDAAVELIAKVEGRDVSNGEILDYLTEKGISTQLWKDRGEQMRGMAQMLHNEQRKVHGRIRKAGWGRWNIKRDKHPFARKVANDAQVERPATKEELNRFFNTPWIPPQHEPIVKRVLEMIRAANKPVDMDQIMESLTAANYRATGDTGLRTIVAGILSREEKKKAHPRIKRVGVATYDLYR